MDYLLNEILWPYLSGPDEIDFLSHIEDLQGNEKIHCMQQYIQHGNTTTYSHCMSVAYYTHWLCHYLPFQFDMRSATRGALLHDFYLYDWHTSDASHRLHGFFHPQTALSNAKKHFELNHIEADIIEKHMWPLTITKLPRCRESVVVCFVDKLCSIAEILRLKLRY